VKKVEYAIEIAESNATLYPNLSTVLFFDEANVTEAIGLIKEIMCDRTINGKPLRSNCRLHFIAACNPYRKHSEEMIQKLERAGLGYHIRASQTHDRLGHIPMRQLVYRVQALPQSMLPLVWDFGQLNESTETLYIRQMVNRYIEGHEELLEIEGLQECISEIIASSQSYMRQQKVKIYYFILLQIGKNLVGRIE